MNQLNETFGLADVCGGGLNTDPADIPELAVGEAYVDSGLHIDPKLYRERYGVEADGRSLASGSGAEQFFSDGCGLELDLVDTDVASRQAALIMRGV